MYINSRVIVTRDGVIAEDADGVASFTEGFLVLRSKGSAISISGEELMIVSMDEGRVEVSGKICTVSFL